MTQDPYSGLRIPGKFTPKHKKNLLFFILTFAPVILYAQIRGVTSSDMESLRTLFIQTARSYLGTPYLAGGSSQAGMDCSGLVHQAALEGPGIDIPRTAASIYAKSEHIGNEALEPGDLLFFNTTGRLSHVAIFLGGGTFIHAASEGPRTGVIISNMSEAYWKKTYIHAGRILPPEGLKIPDSPDTTAPGVNPFPFGGNIGFRLNVTPGMLWGFSSDMPVRGGALNVEISWVKGISVFPGIGAGLAWDARSESFSVPLTLSLSDTRGLRFFIGTQFHLTAAKNLDRSPQFPGLIGLSWTSKPADLWDQKIRFYQSAEYSWLPGETFGSGFRFNTGLTLSYDI
jgi:probable lipoprotein NlpC